MIKIQSLLYFEQEIANQIIFFQRDETIFL